MSEEEINELEKDNYFGQIQENYDKLSKNDWELHKRFIKEGNNKFGIAKIIRNDDVEKLQKISSQTNFDFNQYIEQSMYERCSFINQWNISLIDYAAFFGSIKCFKYLLMNGADVYYTGKYAIASGNAEIIHLCEQNHASFKGAYETAIQFHQKDIFKYLYEYKIRVIDNLEELGKFCILYHNYEIFLFLLENGLKIDDDIINESAKICNLFLFEYFLLNYKIRKNILSYSSNSGNIELVKYILEQKGIDINAKNEYGETALIYASDEGYTEIVQLLLEQEGIDINAKYNLGKTALMKASENGHTEIVKLLLEQEVIDINAKDIIYLNNFIFQNNIWKLFKLLYTALMLATKNGYTEIVKLLLDQKGIDINAKNEYGNYLNYLKQHLYMHLMKVIQK